MVAKISANKNMDGEHFIAKEDTQQREFLQKYPEFDGRGIKIAIIDNDVVDKSLPRMQTTTTGLPKIIDCLGNIGVTVDASKIVERFGKDYIIGLTGQRLMIPSKWKNPSDQWHIGSIGFEKLYEATMAEYEEDDKKEVAENSENDDFSLYKNKILDCIVWFDGKKWRACIDTTFLSPKQQTWFSDLSDLKILANFNLEKEYGCLIGKSVYGINITNDGNKLQILRPHFDHGAIVAYVAGGYFPDNPERNGFAPGAQIVSMNLADLEEALLKCIEFKVDIVNLSVTFILTPSRIKMIKAIFEEHGIIITQAAGNFGPFYSSIPKDFWRIADQLFIIGSIFTEEMNAKFDWIPFYKNRNLPTPDILSSKGPLLSGARGVDFVASGMVSINLQNKWYKHSEINEFPQWLPNRDEINNCCQHGTSFAAPNVAGSIACLLSALKANQIPYSPAMIKMALANTAFLPDGADRLAFGNGIIKILDAFEFIKISYQHLPMKFIVPISKNQNEPILFSFSPNKKGVLIIQNDKNDNNNAKNYQFSVNIDPKLTAKWILKCIPNDQNFVSHSETLSEDNCFDVKIDTNSLKEGSINYAEIQGFDSLNFSLGPFFHLPITVISPVDANSFHDKIICIKPGPPTYYYIKVPTEFQQSQFCIKITAADDDEYLERKLLHVQYRQKSYIGLKDLNDGKMETLIFTTKKKCGNIFFDFKEKEEYFQICFSHNYSDNFNCNIDISFQKA